MSQREPDPNDLAVLAKALADFGVEYALIGGTAMAVHGFARATKDIDLLLPVDAGNVRPDVPPTRKPFVRESPASQI